MIWDECFADKIECEYAKCTVCDKYPALNIICGMCKDDFEGPFCNKHWYEYIDKQFDNLDKRLDVEGWGSSPEIAPEPPVLGQCEMCENDMYKIYTLRWCHIYMKVCSNCYDKYSIR